MLKVIINLMSYVNGVLPLAWHVIQMQQKRNKNEELIAVQYQNTIMYSN